MLFDVTASILFRQRSVCLLIGSVVEKYSIQVLNVKKPHYVIIAD